MTRPQFQEVLSYWPENRWLDGHQWLNGHEFEQTSGDGDGQGSLVCYSPWGYREPDMTEQLNNKPYTLGVTLSIRSSLIHSSSHSMRFMPSGDPPWRTYVCVSVCMCVVSTAWSYTLQGFPGFIRGVICFFPWISHSGIRATLWKLPPFCVVLFGEVRKSQNHLSAS